MANIIVKLTTSKFVSKNGKVFRIPKKFLKLVACWLEDLQAVELTRKLVEYLSEMDETQMGAPLERFTEKLFDDNFLNDLNENTDKEGNVDWKTFLA